MYIPSPLISSIRPHFLLLANGPFLEWFSRKLAPSLSESKKVKEISNRKSRTTNFFFLFCYNYATILIQKTISRQNVIIMKWCESNIQLFTTKKYTLLQVYTFSFSQISQTYYQWIPPTVREEKHTPC